MWKLWIKDKVLSSQERVGVELWPFLKIILNFQKEWNNLDRYDSWSEKHKIVCLVCMDKSINKRQ
jgi:hypothetical protein